LTDELQLTAIGDVLSGRVEIIITNPILS